MKNSRRIARLLFTLLLAGSVFIFQHAPLAAEATEWPGDLPAALLSAAQTRRPVLVFIEQSGDIASIDARHWTTQDKALAPLLEKFVCVKLDAGAAELLPYRSAHTTGFLVLTHAGEELASEEIPPLRANLRAMLEQALKLPISLTDLAKQASAAGVAPELAFRAIDALRRAGLPEQAYAVWQQQRGRSPQLNDALGIKLELQMRFSRAEKINVVLPALVALQRVNRLEKPQEQLLAALCQDAAPLLIEVEKDDAALVKAFEATRAALAACVNAPQADEALKALKERAAELLPLLGARGKRLASEAREFAQAMADAHADNVTARLYAMRALMQDPQRRDNAPAIKMLLEGALATDIAPDELLRGINVLAYAAFEFGDESQQQKISELIRKLAPVGRYTADAYLDLADLALTKGQPEAALEHYKAAEKAAGGGESIAFYRTARAARALIDGRASPTRSKWAKREVLDMLVLVHDLPSFAAALALWNEKQFFPVLFADDLYAPKFAGAFKPAQVVVIPPAPDAAAPTPEQLRGILASSLARDSKANGIVVTDGAAGELAGALALAAGRFQPLEFIAPPAVADGGTERAANTGDQLSRTIALKFCGEIREALTRAGLPRDEMLAHVTLAGNYPYRYAGREDNFGGTFALDDLIGRDEGLQRIAAVGRLCGDHARSAYQAACGLFLQPEQLLLYNNYGTDPKVIWGQYRMDFVENELKALPVTHLRNGSANIESFREQTAPWNRQGMICINSSGGAHFWNVHGGGGMSEDFPVGAPVAMHVTHSYSAANVYDSDTLAGRAVWGGAYFYFGSASEPYLTSFQPSSNFAPRLALGAPFASVFRQRIGQQFWMPWRLMIVGDPQFCLLKQPLKRRPANAKEIPSGAQTLKAVDGRSFRIVDNDRYKSWLNALRQTRWHGNRAAAWELSKMARVMKLGGEGLALALEEALQSGDLQIAMELWTKSGEEPRNHYAARLYARQAAAGKMDKALAGNDAAALLAAFDVLLTTGPAHGFVERWTDKAGAVAEKANAKEKFQQWLQKQSSDAGVAAYRGNFGARVKRARWQELLALPAWSDSQRDEARNALADAVRAKTDATALGRQLEEYMQVVEKKSAGTPAAARLDELRKLFAADSAEAKHFEPLLKAYEQKIAK